MDEDTLGDERTISRPRVNTNIAESDSDFENLSLQIIEVSNLVWIET